jgi:hypothetical protein
LRKLLLSALVVVSLAWISGSIAQAGHAVGPDVAEMAP